MKRYNHLTKEQRYTISVCLRKKMSLSAIAKLIDVSKSTVSREIKKNSNMYRHYVAIEAQQFSEMRKKIPRRPRKLSKEDWQDIEQCLKRHWSPETIVGVRKREGKTCVSIEWLYHIIRRDKERGGTLYTYLPHHLKHRKKPVSSRIPIKDRVSIDERPAVVDSKSRFGDWELDTIVGKDGKGIIVSIVERTTKKMLMAKSPKGKNAKAVAKVVVQLLRPEYLLIRTEGNEVTSAAAVDMAGRTVATAESLADGMAKLEMLRCAAGVYVAVVRLKSGKTVSRKFMHWQH